jgi:DNA-binding transcriptional LysR family regulator
VTTDIELRHLRIFVTLAEELHFGRAAKRLFLTQPPLSKAIHQLEDSVGVRLFVRDSKHVALTAAGAVMLPKARETLRHAYNWQELGKAVALGLAGRITVGFTGAMLFRGLTAITTAFTERYAEIELSFQEATSQRQVEMIRSGTLDAGFINSPLAPAGLGALMVYKERHVACVPTSHPLAGARKISLRALRHETFLTFSRDASPAYFDQMMAMCASAGFQPATHRFGGQILTLVAMGAAGMGVSLVPESVALAGMKGAAFVPLTDSRLRPSAFFVWRADQLSPSLTALIEVVGEGVVPRPFKSRKGV